MSTKKDRTWIGRKEAVELIGSTGGEFFGAVTRKRTNGQFRKFNCRLGVKKGVTGVGLAYDPSSKGLIVVWDGYKKSFRMIGVPELVMVRIAKQTYYIKPEEEKDVEG